MRTLRNNLCSVRPSFVWLGLKCLPHLAFTIRERVCILPLAETPPAALFILVSAVLVLGPTTTTPAKTYLPRKASVHVNISLALRRLVCHCAAERPSLRVCVSCTVTTHTVERLHQDGAESCRAADARCIRRTGLLEVLTTRLVLATLTPLESVQQGPRHAWMPAIRPMSMNPTNDSCAIVFPAV